MKTWPTKKLGEVCEVVGGGTPSTRVNDYWGNDYFWITPKDLGQITTIEVSKSGRKISKAGLKNSSAQLLPIGSVILSSRAPIGYVVINTVEIATNQGCRSFVCGSKIYNRYLYYFLSFNTDYLNSLGSGSTFREVSGSRLKEVEIPLPPLEIQRKIVKKIEELFAKISQAKSLRESAIQDTNNLIPATLSKIFEEGKLKGWKGKELNELCDLQNGFAFKSSDYIKDSNTLNIRMSNIRPSGIFDPNHNIRFLPDFYVDKYSSFLLNEGDLVIAMTDMATDPKILGIPTLVRNLNGRNFLLNQRVGKLFDFSPSIYIPFLKHYLSMQKVKEYYKNKGGGGLQINISKKDILSVQVPVPPIAEQKKIVERMDAVTQKVRELQQLQSETTANLTALKQSILHQAFEGRLIN